MKKLIVAILAVLYLGVSSGATLHLHYCMGKLTGVNLFEKEQKKCAKCGMPKKPGKSCCTDEHKFVKLAKDHTAASSFIQLLQTPAVAPVTHYDEVAIHWTSSLPEKYPVSHAPPYPDKTPLFLRNCVFLI